jgi:membrane protein implicated in regulation of membrane protease activity
MEQSVESTFIEQLGSYLIVNIFGNPLFWISFVLVFLLMEALKILFWENENRVWTVRSSFYPYWAIGFAAAAGIFLADLNGGPWKMQLVSLISVILAVFVFWYTLGRRVSRWLKKLANDNIEGVNINPEKLKP